MKDNIFISDFGQFEEVITSLKGSYKRIQDIFNSERSNAERINATDTWTGPAQKALHGKYIDLMKNFGTIEYSLDLYIKFIEKTLEDYKLLDENMKNNLEEHTSALDVNS